MTGATSTTGGGGGAAARTLPLLQPSAWSRRTALSKAADICFIIFSPQSWLLNFRFSRVTGAPESGRCSVEGKCALRVVSSISGAPVTRLPCWWTQWFQPSQRQIGCHTRDRARSRRMNEFFRRDIHAGCQTGQNCQESRLLDLKKPVIENRPHVPKSLENVRREESLWRIGRVYCGTPSGTICPRQTNSAHLGPKDEYGI